MMNKFVFIKMKTDTNHTFSIYICVGYDVNIMKSFDIKK